MWIVSTGGAPWGPCSDAQILQMIQSGQLRDGHIATSANGPWMPLRQHPPFAAALGGPPAPMHGAPMHGAPMHGAPMHGAPMHGAPMHGAPMHGAPMHGGPMHGMPPGATPPGPHGAAAPGAKPAGPARSKAPLFIALAGGLAVLVAVAIGLIVMLAPEEEAPIGPEDVLPPDAQARAQSFEATLAAIRRIPIDQTPAVAVDGYSGAKPPPFIAPMDRHDPAESSLLIYADDLRAPKGWADVPFAVPHSVMATCMSYAEGVRTEKKRSYDRRTLEGCTALKHLFVVRHLAVTPPTIPHTTEEGTTRTYHMKKGTVRAEALVFEIASGRLLGGFRFQAESSPEPPNANLGEPNELLRKDLEKNVLEAFKAAVAKHRRP